MRRLHSVFFFVTLCVMNTALTTLKERGFFQQCTDVERLSGLMDQGPVTFYVGSDPTAGSLHIGHLVPQFAADTALKNRSFAKADN